MRIDLSKDPLFQSQESPSKDFKQRERYRVKSLHTQNHKNYTRNIQIVDPLPQELKQYKDQIYYKKSYEPSKASHKLKKYIIEQQKNLRCMRLKRITGQIDLKSYRSGFSSKMRAKPEFSQIFEKNLSDRSERSRKVKQNQRENQHQRREEKSKEINIPKIEDLFKNQQRQFVLYQSRMMRNQLAKAMSLIDNGVSKLRTYTMSGTTPTNISSALETRKNTASDRLPQVNLFTNPNSNDQEYEIDKIIEKRLSMSKKLRQKMMKEKKEMLSNSNKESIENKNLSFFLSVPQKPKKKVMLKGVKSITFCQGSKKLKVTPASSLLFSLNRMSEGKDRKQEQLQGLIQNSWQNRDSILNQKSTFYEQQNPFENLNPSNQFRLRQLMDKKLQHRLQLSREQVNKFTSYLQQIKQYHVILNRSILEILREVREGLVSGKVMKISDFQQIVNNKDQGELKDYPNNVILQNLSEMMI